MTIQPQSPGAQAGWRPSIEIVPDGNGRLAARVCTYWFTDGFDKCWDQRIYCANSGTVTLSHWPESEDDLAGLKGYIDVEFDTFTLTGSFGQ